jgi:hypothetical protein
MVSKGVENAQAIVGIVMAVLPWFLRLFGIEIGADIGVVASGLGGLVAADAKTKWT